MHIRHPLRQLNWRVIAMRVLVNGLAVGLTALVLPGISLGEGSLTLNLLLLGVVFGLLNAFIKPILQFLTLPLLFVTYGLILVVINTLLLLLLEWVLPNRIQVRDLWAALLGGLLIGVLTLVLENLLGVAPPILDDHLMTTTKG